MKEPIWLEKAALLHLHSESLAEFGGLPGLRDETLLDSALARPQQKFAYDDDADLAMLAAAYGFGLAKNHAFVDGDKRAAFVSIGLFLALNGYRLTAPQPEATQTVLRLAAGDLSEADLADWIQSNSRQAAGQDPQA